MKRIFLIHTVLIATLLLPVMAMAESVSRRDAAAIAEMFFNAAKKIKLAPPNYTFAGREFTTNRLFIPFYVFNHPTGGYVVISAENKAYPILAYSLHGKLEAGKLNAGQKALFHLYGRHIEFIRYRSETADEVIAAWTDIRQHIASLLLPTAEITDLLIPWQEVEYEISGLNHRADVNDLLSTHYTARQWRDMIATQLHSDGNVIMAMSYEQGELVKMVVTGQRADYFRLCFSERGSDAMYRLHATEDICDGQVALLRYPLGAPRQELTNETPFSFYDNFIKELHQDSIRRRENIDKTLHQNEPVVNWEGSGRFSIWLPENALHTVVYNVAGMRVYATAYRNSNLAAIDISACMPGFYVALIRCESGKTYSLRLYR